jgi:hypothetical protein
MTKCEKRAKLIGEISNIIGFFKPYLMKMTCRELKRELKLRIRILKGKFIGSKRSGAA